MNNFEHGPQEEKDPIAEMEELKYGRFSVPDEEKERITKKALAEGKDPELALREHEERLAEATNRIRKQQTDEAIKDLERDMNKAFEKKPDKN